MHAKLKYKLQSWAKHLQTSLRFSTISLVRLLSSVRLLSPESECTSYLTSCRTTKDLGISRKSLI